MEYYTIRLTSSTGITKDIHYDTFTTRAQVESQAQFFKTHTTLEVEVITNKTVDSLTKEELDEELRKEGCSGSDWYK